MIARMRLIVLTIIFGISINTSSAQKYSQNQNHYIDVFQESGYVKFNHASTDINSADDILLYLTENNKLLNLPGDALVNLKYKSTKYSLLGRHLIYQVVIDTIPVINSELLVSINEGGQIYKLYHSIQDYEHVSRIAEINQSEAIDIAWLKLRIHGKLLSIPSAQLHYITQGDSLILCYKVNIDTEAPHGYWGLIINAGNGEVISVYENAITEKPRDVEFGSYNGKLSSREFAIQEFNSPNQSRNNRDANLLLTVRDGTAQVFDPDPRTTLEDATLEDNNPPSDFTNAYLTRTLQDIDETGGIWALNGPWVEIIDFEAPNTAPSTTTNGNWNFTRGNNAFNDAMTYFHIDQNQRYVQTLGFTGSTGIQDAPIEADTDGLNGDDNAKYYVITNRITFGHGCVDGSEDADLILHEYMHALLYDINSNYFPPSGDLGALNEGFADYWAGSYSYSTPNGVTFNPNWFCSWDGHNNCWDGRVLNDTNLQYNPLYTYTAHGRGYWDDEMWSAPLFQSMIDIINNGGTRQQMDRIVLEANFGLGANLTMRQMAQSIVNTAELLYPDNIHTPIILDRFTNQNYVLDDVYVDASHSGTEDGTSTNPFNTIMEGYELLLPSGTLRINSGNYSIGNNTLDKRMTIIAEGGTVTIGY